MDKEFVYTSFQCTMDEEHCVKATRGEGGGGQNFSGQNAAKRDENDLTTASD